MSALLALLLAAGLAGEELVPYKPQARPKRKGASGAAELPPSEDQLRGEREAAAFHIKALAAAEQLRKDVLYRYIELEDVLLEPSAWNGKAVSFLAFPNSIKIASDKPSGSFSGGHTIFHLTASFAGLSAAKRKELLAAQDGTERRLLAVRGTVRSALGAPFLDTEDFLDLGPVPRWSPAEVATILESPEVVRTWDLSSAELAAEVVSRLKRDRGARYVAIEDLLIEPAAYAGKAVQVLGATYGLTLGGSAASLRLSNRFAAGDFIQVALGGLPRGELKTLLRRSAGSAFLAVKGRVKEAPNGLHYLDALRAEWLGHWGSMGEFTDRAPAVGFGRFRRVLGGKGSGKGRAGPGRGFEERDAAMSAYRDRALAALEQGKGWRGHELVEVEDLLVSPRGYAGRRVSFLGCPSGCQDGAVGRFCSVGNCFSSGAAFPVRLDSLPEAKRKEAAAWDGLGGMALMAVAVHEEQGRIYGQVEDFVDVCKHPPGQLARPDEVLSFKPGRRNPTKEDVRDRVRSAAEEAKAEGRRYIRFEDLIVEPGPLIGKPVAIAGVMQRIEVGGSRPYFKLVVAWVGSDEVSVAIGRLSHDERKRLFRLSFPPHALLVRGVVRAANNGAIYLDADSVTDCGPDSGDALKEGR